MSAVAIKSDELIFSLEVLQHFVLEDPGNLSLKIEAGY
jgi:hypothetical protein